MDSQKNLKLNRAIAIILFMLGFALITIPAYLKAAPQLNSGFDWELVVVSIGTSVAAAGVILIVQIYFLGDASYRVETQLREVLVRKLPVGVLQVFLRLKDARSFEDILRNSRKVTFWGPGGAFILSQVSDEASKRSKTQRIILEMFLPFDKNEVAENVGRPDFKKYDEWYAAKEKADSAVNQGKLELRINYVPIEPTVSAVQVDDSYYQLTMLFPRVDNSKRPTLALDSSIAREEYFEPLWDYLRGKVKK